MEPESSDNKLIRKVKWDLSELAGRDVGTPYTVDFITRILAESYPFSGIPPRNELIRNYLLSEIKDDRDAPDKSRLKGELMRWEARRKGINPRDVELTTLLKHEYAEKHGFSLR